MLPQELVDHILDYLHDDIESLAACAFAGRALLHASRYHRFNGRNLTYTRAMLLQPLLVASSGLAASITTLAYQPFGKSYKSTNVPAAVTFLQSLPNLIDLRIQARALPYIKHLSPQLAYLRVDDIWAESRRGLLVSLSLFPTLQELVLSDPYLMPHPVELEHDLDTHNLPAPNVRKLSFRDTSCAEFISRWFGSQGLTPPLHSVVQTIRGRVHTRLFVAQSRTLAPLVQDLEIVFKPDGTMEGALQSTGLTLAPYVALHSCTLRFALPEMCVAENVSLTWIPTIIDQLSSPCLRSLTISLVVDNVEDPRSLNSECAVRVLTPAYFDDMRVLDWATIGRALAADRLEGLRRVVLEGRGSIALLEEHLGATCPELHTRHILSLTTVAKEAAWAD